MNVPGVKFLDYREGSVGPLVRQFDWSQTSIGDMKSWPATLQGYVSMILSLPSPAIIFWGEDRVQIYNDGYAQIMGPRHPKNLGATYKECWPDTYPIIDPWMDRVMKGEVVTVDKTFIVMTRNGFAEETYFTFSFSPLRDCNQNIAGILQLVQEVTQTIQQERRLETIKRLSMLPLSGWIGINDILDVLAQNPNDIRYACIFLKEKDNSLRMMGNIGEEKIDASDWHEHLSESELRVLPHGNSIAIPLKRSENEEARGILVVGLSAIIRFDDNYKTFLLDAAREIALAIESEEQSRYRTESEEALKLAITARDEFLSIASHELKTPITALKLQLQLARRSMRPDLPQSLTPDRFRKVLDSSINQVDRLTKLVDDLLDVSRIQAGKMHMDKCPVDLGMLVSDVVDRFSDQFKINGCETKISINTSPMIMADIFRIEQVVTNLLTNALKYGDGSPIHISVDAKDGKAELVVRDFGMGINKNMQDKIFERFERAISHENISGLGLGLYITKQIVESHHGEIRVTSELAAGSTFTILFPEIKTLND